MLLTRLGVPCLVSNTCYAFHSALLCYCHCFKIGDFPYFLSDLVNVFEVFLPQLLLYPNASDPLNGDAAALMIRDHATYEQRVKGGNPFSCIKLQCFFHAQFMLIVRVFLHYC